MMSRAARPYSEMTASGVTWIGDVPVHWNVCRTKSFLLRNDGGVWGSDFDDQGTIVVRSTEQTADGGWNLLSPARRRLSRSEYSACRLDVGDLLVTKSSGSQLHIGKTTIVTNEIADLDCCFSNFMQRLRVNGKVTPRFLWYVFNGTLGRRQLDYYSDTTTGLANLNAETIGNVILAVPPSCEQDTIVRFLDHADRAIQRYIRAKQKLIALLEEQKQALIHEAVTGRIDVRTGRPYPTYKESGVEWLGTVPSHWEICRSKRAFRPRTELARPGDTQLSATQAYGVIAQVDYEEKIGRKITRILRNLDQRRHVEIDDFVISMRSFQGGLERAWTVGCIRSSYIVLHAATELIVGYFAYLFKSFGYIGALQSTANFIRDGQDLNFENFCRVDVPFPPMDEQQHIAQALDRGTDHITAGIERSRRQIAFLFEYRARLVADVVTGKLDVRKAAAGLSETDSLGAEDGPDISIDHDTDRSETTIGS